MGELKSFGHGLDEKPMLVVASKADVANPEKLKKLQTMAKRRKAAVLRDFGREWFRS
jgi:GTP-binding protein